MAPTFSAHLSFLIDELLLGKLSETVAVFGSAPHICFHFGWSQRGSAISGPPVARQQCHHNRGPVSPRSLLSLALL
jgi:hypothetical protein